MCVAASATCCERAIAKKMLYFRRSPRVPLRLLRDSQLMLLRLLNTEPGTMDDLRQRTTFRSHTWIMT